jgi:hypothetical protein
MAGDEFDVVVVALLLLLLCNTGSGSSLLALSPPMMISDVFAIFRLQNKFVNELT